MSEAKSPIQNVSDTAFWVAYYRAQETERPDALFHDPLAKTLIDERAPNIDKILGASSAYTQFNVVMRTVIIDRYIQDLVGKGVDTVVNLGAGLDTRPYRLALPPDLRWVEVDYPALMEFKTDKLGLQLPNIRLERISLDLADRVKRRELFKTLAGESSNILVITEGVLPYLTQDQVSQLAEDLYAQKSFRYWIADYMSAGVYKHLQTKKRRELMKNAPFQFFPEDWLGFFKGRGWNPETLQYIPQEAMKLNRYMKLPWYFLFVLPFISQKTKEQFMRSSGYMIMTRNG